MSADNPLFLRVDQIAQRNERFLDNLKDSQQPLHDLSNQIAEHRYRNYVKIPFTYWGIRPFWRDGRVTPSLPIRETAYRSHHY